MDAIKFGRVAATLPVTDMARAEGFYCGALGFNKTFTNGDPVQFMIVRRDGAELHLSLQPGHKAADFNIAHMIVDDAKGLYRLCDSLGVRIVKRLEDKDHGLRAFVLADPDGNRIDVGQPI